VAGKYLLPEIETELRQRALPWNTQATEVRAALHGADTCVMGGVAMVIQSILAHPELFLNHPAPAK
jgi:hypothetical protein